MALLPLEALREADDAPAEPQPSTAELRAQAQAARQALTAVLRDRAALYATTDAELGGLVDDALAKVLAMLAGQPTDYQLWVLPRLVTGLRQIADDLVAQVGQRASGAMNKAWTLGANAVDAPLPTTAAAAALGQPDARQLRALQVMTTQQIGGATAEMVTRINRELGQVVLGVQAPFAAVQATQAILTDRTRKQVEGIVHLSLGQAFNTAAFQRLQQQAGRDPAIKKMWRRSGKRHSRPGHDAIDGVVAEVAEPFTVLTPKGAAVALMYPCDPAAPVGETINCGCVLIPWKATWGMKYKGAKPQAQAAAPGPKAAPPRQAAGPAAPATQAKALAAFGASITKSGQLRDVTGQLVVVDARAIGPAPAAAALTAGKQDLAAYWTVQALRKPTEVWQSERIDPATGEVQLQREFVKRFAAAGQQWVATLLLRPEATGTGQRWVAARPLVIQAGQPGAQSALRPGVRVWPRKG